MGDLLLSFEDLKKPTLARELQHAEEQLSARGLVQSATWVLEILEALPTPSESDLEQNPAQDPDHVPEPTKDPKYRLAKRYFETRQYRRVCNVLQAESSSLSRFLRMYSQFLAGERRREEERLEVSTWTEQENVELYKLRDELNDLREKDELDGHLWYLLGVILKRLKQYKGAINAFEHSLTLFPYNRGAWLELAPLCESRRDAEAVNLSPHWMRTIFVGTVLNDTENPNHAREIFEALTTALPACRFSRLQLALSLYHLRLFDEAQQLLDEVYSEDPFCLDGVDIYSNILYVKEDKVQLSLLANKCINIDKFRLETCCVIGNYFSLRGQHEQALDYFQRALKINRNYLSAWTLMGHEFLEMKNTAAAVEAYRSAIDINPTDFRAWYGLGQTYEFLDMPMYTLYYFQKAATLRPYDARMWCAVAGTLQSLKKWNEAIRCYDRAVGCNDREGLALGKLASLYKKLAEEAKGEGRQRERYKMCQERAAKYYDANLTRRDEEKLGGQPTAEALRYLAEYYYEKDELEKAQEYGRRLSDFPGHDKDFVRKMMREVHSRRVIG